MQDTISDLGTVGGEGIEIEIENEIENGIKNGIEIENEIKIENEIYNVENPEEETGNEEDESVQLEMWHKEQNDVEPSNNNDVTLDFGGDDVFNIVPT